MSVQINVQASQTALAQSIAQGVAAFNARYAGQNQLNLQINARNFSQPLGRITSDLADFESALKASNARVLAFGASTAVLGGVTKAFKEIANVTLEVEKSLTDINRVLNLSTSGLQKFSSDLFNVSKQTASSFDDASKAALEFSRQGLDTEETLKRTADALTLVRLTGISSTKAVEDLTATINGFSKAGLTTTQVVNKLAAVEQDFAVSAGDLTEALSRTGQAAQEAGVDFDQLNALVTTAQQNTARGGAVIGNALKTIFTRLQRTETLDQLEKFNIIVRDVQGNILPAVQILQNFANKYNDLADAQRAQLSEQVAGVYQVNILKGIITDLTGVQSTYSKALERGAQASNEADIANQKLNKTLSALAAQTGVGLQQLANNIGKVTFAPLFEAIVSPINDAVQYINDTLEGEGPGSIFANGLLKGIRNVIAGPGLAVTFAVIAKVAKNTFEDATKALPAILGLTTEAQKRANIEKSIIAILQTQSNLSLALQGQQGNATTQAATILNYAKLQTAQYQQQLQIAQQLAPLLAAQNVTVGARGIQVGPRIKAGGHIPAFAEMSERMGAAMGGYKSGKVVKAPTSVGANTYMNSAEDVKYVSGFAQPFINPPANSKAGRKHRQNAINRTGIDPYMANGFIPNFAKNITYFNKNKNKDTLTLAGTKNKPFLIPNNKELANVADVQKDSVYDLTYKIKLAGSYSRFSDAFDKKMLNTQQADRILLFSSLEEKQRKTFSKNYKKYISSGKDFQVEPFTPNIKETISFSKQLQGVKSDTLGTLYELYLQKKFNLQENPNQTSISDLDFIDAEAKIGDFSSANLLSKAIRDNAVKKGIKKPYYKDNKSDEIDLNNRVLTLYTTNASKGFIPNFAPPTSAIRVPWFKKFGNASFDAIQPTLGISKANDTDTFRSSQFRSKAFEKAATDGDPNLFAPLYEDFIFKALQLVSQPKIKDQLIRGYVNQPGTDQKQSAFDAFLGDVGLEFKGFPKGNLTGSISKNLNDKYERYAKANPAGAAKIKESIIAFNEIGDKNQLPSDFGKNFSQLAGTSYSEMVKNNPDLVKGLSAETNMLLQRYVKDPAFLAVAAAGGFIPNFAYKQSVMALEEGMSGKNAILDTTTGPFPFIRNSGQPNFASAISDHGGLKNALNDSMRNQEAVGLMSKGFIPNFATLNAQQALGISFKGLGANEQKLFVDMNKALSELTRNTKLTSQQQQILVNTVQTNALTLQQSTKSTSIVNDANNALVKALQQNATAQQKAAAQATAQAAANTPRAMPTASSTRVAINPNNITQPTQPSRFQSLNNKLTNVVNNPAFQIAVPMIAGQLESIVARGRDRSQMGYAERLASTGASATLTGASTGAFIGSMVLPGIGTAAGAAIGAIVGFSGAMTSAKDKVEDFNKVVGDFIQRDKEQEDAVQGYLNSLKKLEQGGLSPKEQLKTEKERQKFLLKIPSALRNQISPTGTSVEVQNLFEQFEQRNEKRQKVMSLSILGASDRTEYDVERAMQTIAELATIDDSFKKIGAILIKASSRDERATLFEKGGIIQTLLKQSDIVKSLDPKQQIKLFEDFKTTFDPSFYDKTLGESSAGQDYKAIRFLNERFGNMISAKQDIKKGAGTLNVQRSATSIYTAIENFLSETNIELKRNLAAEEFKDKFDELKSTFNNVLIEGLLTPAQFVESELKDKKSFLQNSFDRETRKANFEFSKTFAEQIRNTPVFGASPDIMARLETLTANKNAGVQEYQSFFESIVNQNVTEDTINKFKELLRAQKFAEEERSTNLQRETKILEENARQQRIRKELAIFEANDAASSARYASQRESVLREQESRFKIDQAKSQSYLNYQPNFYNMPMQQQSELQIRYREQESKKSLELQTKSDIENAKKVAEAASNRINNEIRKLEASGSSLSPGIIARMRNSYFADKKDADNLTLEGLPQLIRYQKEYLAGLDKLDPMYQDELNTLKDLETIHRDINIKVKEETELLKIRNEEDRRRLRDAKSFSVGLSAGFNSINQERETFRKDFGEKIPGLFRDGLVGAMDAALNKADDLESALMGVAASFLREIQGMMLRNIANNIVGSIGSAFSFGQPAAGVEPSFQQRGGIIRAQKGMYISGGRTGDKNPALLEDGEYVLNRNAVKALGGPRAIDNLNFNAFPRFATGGDPGTMSASADAGAAFERLSMFGREQSPEFQNYMDKIREEEAAKEKKRAERKALLNQFLGTLITTGISMGLSSAVSAAKESASASANLKGATGTMADGKTSTQVTSFSDAKKLINSGGSVTLGDGSVINKSSFGSSAITKSAFNDIAASRFAASGISVRPGSIFGGKPNYNVQGTTTPYNALFPEYGTQVNANFGNLGSASNFTRNMSNFKPRVPNVGIRGGRQEGGIIGLNQGGFLPYGSRLTDSIPAYLSGGEYVVNSKAVRKYGVGGLNRINAGIARFQDGGPVQSDMMSPSDTSNSSNSNIAINITVNATNGKSDGEQSDNNGDGTEGNAKELSNRIKSVVLDVITNEQRTGGLLDSTKKR